MILILSINNYNKKKWEFKTMFLAYRIKLNNQKMTRLHYKIKLIVSKFSTNKNNSTANRIF